jgi:L,D-peptidoglycan transpeptidase YkuD (ErfK/YbiS/YcfS/YnhG family)
MPMKAITLFSLLVMTTVAATAEAASPAEVFSASQQLLVVTTPSAQASAGQLQRYQRSDTQQSWQPVGSPISVTVGRNGLASGSGLLAPPQSSTIKREGDGRSPEGVFALGTSFGYAASALPGASLPYLALSASTECVDDAQSRHYNRIVARTATADWKSSERMREMGEYYRWGVVVDHNHIAAPDSGSKPAAGGGSCIFLHVWKEAQPTSGCTAMAQPDIESLLLWLDPRKRPLLVQLTTENYAALRGDWRLP